MVRSHTVLVWNDSKLENSLLGVGDGGRPNLMYKTQSSLLAAFPLGRNSFNVFLLNFLFVALGLPMSSCYQLTNEQLMSVDK